jgi:hypothetical protein
MGLKSLNKQQPQTQEHSMERLQPVDVDGPPDSDDPSVKDEYLMTK